MDARSSNFGKIEMSVNGDFVSRIILWRSQFQIELLLYAIETWRIIAELESNSTKKDQIYIRVNKIEIANCV